MFCRFKDWRRIRGLEILQRTSTEEVSLRPGDEVVLNWPVRTGTIPGSFPLRAEIQATIELPVRKWERNRVLGERLTIKATALLVEGATEGICGPDDKTLSRDFSEKIVA